MSAVATAPVTYTLTPTVVEYLKNISDINTQVFFQKGTKQRVCNGGRNLIADFELEEAFPNEFAIFELNKIVSLIDTLTADKNLPTVTFGENTLYIEQGSMRATVPYSHPDAVQKAPTADYTMSEQFAVFTLDAQTWGKIRRIASVLGHDTLHVEVTNSGEVKLKTLDGTGKANDKNRFVVKDAQVFKKEPTTWAIKLEAMKFLPGDYKVEIGSITHASATQSMFGAFFTLADPSKKVQYLTGGHVVKTR